MPPEGAEARGQQLALIGRLGHERQTSTELGQLLDELKPYAATLDPDSDDARLVKVTVKDYDKALRIPTHFVEEFARVTTMANMAWVEARQKADFSLFSPHMEKVLELDKQYVSYFPEMDHPYDALLDVYEPGMKTADVKTIFEALRPQQVALIQAIRAKPQVDDSFLHQPFDEQKQWDFGVEVITRFGYDWKRGRQDKAPHPFTIGFGLHDVRITTRVAPDFLNSMIFGTMHECGHALYGLGVAPRTRSYRRWTGELPWESMNPKAAPGKTW